MGIPDGSTVDAEGGVWNARFKGGAVVRFNPEGSQVLTVKLPVPNVTCCCIGGAHLDRLYITTARLGMEPDALARTPSAGGRFAVDIDYKGLEHGQFIPEERIVQ
jgi:L-arabinonolactonase